MIFRLIFINLFLLSLVFTLKAQDKKNDDNCVADIEITRANGEKITLSEYEGKVLLIVNVASKCGYTPQYADLQELYEEYKDKGLEIPGFPCNDFGGQEPGTNEEIKRFCRLNYRVTFEVFDKVKILGENKSPLYEILTNNSITGNEDVKWNFEKFVISKKGKIVGRFISKVKPLSDELVGVIENQLRK